MDKWINGPKYIPNIVKTNLNRNYFKMIIPKLFKYI